MRDQGENVGSADNFLRRHAPELIILLFCAQPIANFIGVNNVDPDFTYFKSLTHFVLLFLLSFGAYHVLKLVLPVRDRILLALCVGTFVVLLFLVSTLEPLGKEAAKSSGVEYYRGYVFAVLVAAFVAFVFAARRLIRTKAFVQALTVAMIGVVAVDIGLSIQYEVDSLAGQKSKPAEFRDALARGLTLKPTVIRPNVYLVVPDSYANPRVLQKNYKMDPAILDRLKSAGMRILENSFSNSPVSSYTFINTWRMKYYWTDKEKVTRAEHAEAQKQWYSNNIVYDEFRRRGYKVIRMLDGYIGGCFGAEDICIKSDNSSILSFRTQDIVFLRKTGLYDYLATAIGEYIGYMYLTEWPDRLELPELAELLPDPESGPYFVYLHLGLPHVPFRYNPDCSIRKNHLGPAPHLYRDAVACATRLIPDFIGVLLKKDPTAIVVLQADHGAFLLNQHLKHINDLTTREKTEILSILNAWYLPYACGKHLYDGMSQINSFRLIFACLDGEDPELLPDRSFLTFYYQWIPDGPVLEWSPKRAGALLPAQ